MTERISIDGGQTGTRIRMPDGREVDAGPIRTDRPVVEQLSGYLHQHLTGPNAGVDREVAVGVSGLTPAHARPAELVASCRDLGVREVALAHDSVSAYVGSNGWDFGAVIAVGTGVVGLGVSPAEVTRVDGWGHLFGDAGSAYSIGRSGIEQALRAYDGRSTATVLKSLATERFGPLPELYMALQADPDRVSKVAAFAVIVAEAADHGDDTAARIITAAAAELAHTVCTAATVGHSAWLTPPRISWTGRVLSGNRSLRDQFTARVRASVPDAVVAPPRGEPLDGVALLFDAPPHHPLAAQVHRAADR